MIPYKDLGGDSDVESYEIIEKAILVRFKSGNPRNYLYNPINPGFAAVNTMKELAAQGQGLDSYIATKVRSNFSKRW